MRLKISIVALFALAVCLFPCASYATPITAPVSVTLTLTSTPDGSDYPYDFTIKNGNSDSYNVAMSCLNDNRDVSVNEQWTATAEGLEYLITNAPKSGEVDGSPIADLEADAYLDSLYGTGAGTNAEIQDAIWDILNPGSETLDSAAQKLYNTAYDVEIGTLTETATFYSQFTFYFPSSDSCSVGQKNCQEPQQFLEYTPTVVPEPSSLLLLGTGMVGFAGMVRRRFFRA